MKITLAATGIICCDAFQFKTHASYYNGGRRKFTNPRRGAANAVDDKHITPSIPNTPALQLQFKYVAKTAESFKFADLYWLQAQVMAYCRDERSVVEKLALHRPTASSLLSFSSNSSMTVTEMPFPSNRVQYVGKVVASGATAHELLDSIVTNATKCRSWTLDFDTFEPLLDRQFTKSNLMCAVSRHILGDPLLERNDSDNVDVISYMLVETSSKLYLVEILSANNLPHVYDERLSHFRQEWSRRPFQYSGAVNVEIAITVADMLLRLMQKRNGEELLKDEQRIRILDPTVGSGTFLAAIATLWNHVDGQRMSLYMAGIDSNSKCSEGASKNLSKLFGQEISMIPIRKNEESCAQNWNLAFNNSKSDTSSVAMIYCGDSVNCLSSIFRDDEFDCVVSNLPWNRNTFEYKENESTSTSDEIIKQISEVIKPGKPVIVISGSDESNQSFNAKSSLKSLGFDIIGEKSIPPTDFSLPESGKKKKNGASDGSKRKSSCIVTIAIAPKHT